VVKLDADLRSEYGLDLHDLWKPGTGLTVRRLISYIKELPQDARIWKHLLGEETLWGHQEHLLADVRDVSQQIAYFSAVAAGRQFSKRSEWEKVMKDIPKQSRRPGDPKEEAPTFATTTDLMDMFGGGAIGKPHGRKR